MIKKKYMIAVFIENEAGSDQKSIFDEKKRLLKETIKVSRKYPFPYGFILDTTNEDGDNVDVFVLTDRRLKRGQIVTAKVIGLMEQFEKSWGENNPDKEEIDHNIIARLPEEPSIALNDDIKHKLKEFVTHVFDNIRPNKTRVGNFLGQDAALEFINERRD